MNIVIWAFEISTVSHSFVETAYRDVFISANFFLLRSKIMKRWPRRHEARTRRTVIHNATRKMKEPFPGLDVFFFIISLHALDGAAWCPKFWPAAGKSIVDRHFSVSTNFRRSIPVHTFAVRVFSVCAIDPFSLQVSWEGPWTGRYT